jgi:aconitate hydratase
MSQQSMNSFGARGTLEVGDSSYDVFRLSAVDGSEKLPFCLKVLLENLLRTEDGANITEGHIRALAGWDPNAVPDIEIQFTPARVIMQDFTGVPCIVDLATMREAFVELGGDASRINPLAPAEMVIDHSVIADIAGRSDAFERNVELEYQRNGERYQFLRWGQTCRPAPGSSTRSTSSTSPASSSTATAWPIPTPASAPTRTPPWSTAWASWAGGSAVSRPRLRCSASRSQC